MRKLICFLGKILFVFKSKNSPKDPKNILIMRSGGIGDVLMSTPLVKSIRKHYPKAKITYFVGNWSKDVLKGNPNIDNIFNYDDMIIIGRKWLKILKLSSKLRNKFDLIFNLEKSWHWGLLAWSFKGFRIGFDRIGEGFANNLTVPFNGTKYELEYYLNLARLLKISIPSDEMEMYITEKEESKIKKYMKKNKKILGIAPGGADNPAQQAIIKRWPLENYVELINKLKGWEIILFGGKNDIETCNKIQSKANKNITNTAGKLSLKESAALMKHCSLFLTHDAGPMHMAAAMKVKLIALFGPTQIHRFAPKKAVTIKSICDPCYDIYGSFKNCKSKRCMKSIKVNQVLKKIK